jgi:small-conductance mechanosensitive channel
MIVAIIGVCVIVVVVVSLSSVFVWIGGATAGATASAVAALVSWTYIAHLFDWLFVLD